MRRYQEREFRSAEEIFQNYIRGYRSEPNHKNGHEERSNTLRKLREKIEQRFEEGKERM